MSQYFRQARDELGAVFARGWPGRRAFPTPSDRPAAGWSGARSAAARGRSPSACAIAAFFDQGINVARHDLENPVELSLRFRETPQGDVELGLPGEQTHVARIEPLGLVEVGFGFRPLPLAPGDKGERLRNPAAIGQELARLLVITAPRFRNRSGNRNDKSPWRRRASPNVGCRASALSAACRASSRRAIVG